MMESDLQRLRDLHKQLWKECSSGPPFYHKSKWPVQRLLNSEKRKFLFRCIVRYNLVCIMFPKINQGLGIKIFEPDITLGNAPCPGITYSIKDLKHVISIDEDHIFDDSNNNGYKYREWCESQFGSKLSLFLTYRFFKAIVGREQNLELMKRYNVNEPHILPMHRFVY